MDSFSLCYQCVIFSCASILSSGLFFLECKALLSCMVSKPWLPAGESCLLTAPANWAIKLKPSTPGILVVSHTLARKHSHIYRCINNAVRWHYNMSRVSWQKSPTSHAYAWQIMPFWQDTLDVNFLSNPVNKHPIACLSGDEILSVLWAQTLIYVLPQSW